ncbi:MAG: hypothetical protein M1824_001448 [Vezdaea acicularis]|nr:MAG: hypothetical protein M1824_001448 [Vezdaea acicularis]
MRAAFLISTLIGLAAAQSSLTTPTSSSPGAASTSSCQAQNILDTCLATTKAIVADCAPNDYACLCQKYTDVLT